MLPSSPLPGVSGMLVLAATMGVVRWTRARTRKPLHPLVARYTEVVCWHPSLAQTLSELAAMGLLDEEGMRSVEALRAATLRRDAAAQGHIARLLPAVEQPIVHRLSVAVRTESSQERMQETSYAQQELVPLLRRHLDDVLYNHLMER